MEDGEDVGGASLGLFAAMSQLIYSMAWASGCREILSLLSSAFSLGHPHSRLYVLPTAVAMVWLPAWSSRVEGATPSLGLFTCVCLPLRVSWLCAH